MIVKVLNSGKAYFKNMNNQLQEEMNSLLKLIHKGENESVEFKESLRLKEETGQAVSAFFNANGGSILIGISDALEWCKKNLQIRYPFTIVSQIYAGEKIEYYLKLMIICKHYIISNSSFAWWSAWLNENQGKSVIAPKKWFNDTSFNTIDLIPETWIRI